MSELLFYFHRLLVFLFFIIHRLFYKLNWCQYCYCCSGTYGHCGIWLKQLTPHTGNLKSAVICWTTASTNPIGERAAFSPERACKCVVLCKHRLHQISTCVANKSFRFLVDANKRVAREKTGWFLPSRFDTGNGRRLIESHVFTQLWIFFTRVVERTPTPSAAQLQI